MSINFQDPQTWVAISFILFFLFFGKIIWKKLAGFLDSNIDIIKNEIKESQELHNEAKLLLAHEKTKAQDLENQVKAILEESTKISQDIIFTNKKKIDEEVIKIEKEYQERIAYLEQEAMMEIKKKVSVESIRLAINNIKKNLSDDDHVTLINSSLKELEKGLQEKNIS